MQHRLRSQGNAGPAAMAGHKLESVLLRRFYQRCDEKGWFIGGFGATAMQIKKVAALTLLLCVMLL